ncbi:DUF4401 domain-containing protein [Myroides sp. 1354]|uniref:DUF4401 domain-containing protein n=1 Tax=unclassified Myroides TaxID=2642485 RepID=UPI002576F73A|nr:MULTISPECIES: DUF4401 domain-containing protein [unclassified Myroides]MDM1044579.1 DUF4401 domain-containing protein [Myroides sp. R163-1]MDM1055292.1 DUF4401 domain-containing protein [Myroides sp. 1354]MDM1068589.1 DUF4401 domain-containing protein [Myroides sp. 1372]
MKTNTWKDLLPRLEEQGVIVDEQLENRIQEENAIKYVFLKVVAILGSLLAMGFFFGFLFLTIGDSLGYVSFLFFGIMLYGISLLGNKKTEPALRDGVFVATYISAFVCVLAACFDIGWRETNNLIVVIVLSLAGFILFKSKIIQFLSVIGVYYGLVYYLGLIHLGYGGLLLFWLVLAGLYLLFDKEVEIKTTHSFWSQKYTAVVHAFFLILILELIQDNISLIDPTNWINHSRYFDYNEVMHRIYLAIVGLLLIALTYVTVKQIERKVVIQKRMISIGVSSLFILGIAFFMHGFGMPLAVSLFLLFWSYQFRFHKGIVLAIFTLLLSLLSYYYYLSVSLLVKSIILMGCGLFFLALFIIYNRLNREE